MDHLKQQEATWGGLYKNRNKQIAGNIKEFATVRTNDFLKWLHR